MQLLFMGIRNYAITCLLLGKGMRKGECLSLQPESFDFKHKSIFVKNAKNKQEKYVYFSFRSVNKIKSWMRYKDRYSEAYFCIANLIFCLINRTAANSLPWALLVLAFAL
ncbi:tyrosine-type recombinase/integrase [Paenibacillus sp. S33]